MLRKKSKRHFYIVTVIVVLLVIWTAWSNTTVGITHYTVASDKLPASFDHYSIVVVSDLHNAEFGENNSQLIKLIEKEKPFYIQIPAKDIYMKDIDGEILVQGIIDLYYINKNDELILLDYKTDYAKTKEELINKYKVQLDIYKKALEESLQRKVNKVYIYSLHKFGEIEVS